MNTSRDITDALAEQVRDARARHAHLRIQAGGTKAFLDDYPGDLSESLDVRAHRGIVNYEPSELVLTARCGTLLSELTEVLAASGQILPFEPPGFGVQATLGGVVSAGLSGPRRPFSGSVRDSVLGVRLLTGRGECLHFGGEVMKNVAGYDVSRLITGAWGTLGILLEASVRVMPAPVRTITLKQPGSKKQALALFGAWARQPLSISAACHLNDTLYIRLSGGPAALEAAAGIIGGKEVPDGEDFWCSIREQDQEFFDTRIPLWRLSVPPATPPLDLPGDWLLDWAGAQRWLKSNEAPERIRAAVESAGGHALLFRNPVPGVPRVHPLPAALRALQVRVKAALDPDGLFNPNHSMVASGAP
jgi:glycolate oxidase FAD binding subunit